jgi:hypothetical protein
LHEKNSFRQSCLISALQVQRSLLDHLWSYLMRQSPRNSSSKVPSCCGLQYRLWSNSSIYNKMC